MNVQTAENTLSKLSTNSTINASTMQAVGRSAWYGYGNWFPVTSYNYVHTFGKNQFEQAFKVVSHLLETGAIKELKLKDFIKLIKEVEEIL